MAASAIDLRNAPATEVYRALEEMVGHAAYPCLGAKSVYRRHGVAHLVLRDMDDPGTTVVLLRHLRAFGEHALTPGIFRSFIVSFRAPAHSDEAAFEESLFSLLQRLHDNDALPWAEGVDADPGSPHFAFSVAGTAYFLVGLHPAASRVARRSPLPTVVFNPHVQFQQLRDQGRYDGMRTRIRARDEHFQGSVNPMVADHGESSDARQYSGRYHGPDWIPPLSVRSPEPDGRRAEG
ncbi:guanitoxin biosynthesis heme-dependent pre-guanitoxin N-hydroxylase GntA [Humibacillus xanthopallidus]|uniref:guanitoxin biosynthesis heme-dependent pre-guanitoxin N-hydroxylase GntA n=1 Tax=Humibacillus xanthopallidus TaxID=412689 RepID=UPI00163A981C|nr:guanitoxin biosynthesis heme-dependent pre-guanitoxin N-hydroxylase GntA [Humibacillus xanthopallidus]